MAISPFINFAALPVQGNPSASNFVNSLMQGYQFGSKMRDQRQLQEAQKIKNQMAAQEQAYLPFKQGMDEEKQSFANQLVQAQIDKLYSDMQLARQKADYEQSISPQQSTSGLMESLKKQPKSVQYTYLSNPDWLRQQGYSPEESELIAVNTRYDNLTPQQQERISKANVARETYDQSMKDRLMKAIEIGDRPLIGRMATLGVGQDPDQILAYNQAKHQDIPFLANAIRNLEGIPGTQGTIEEFENVFSSAMKARTLDRRKKLMQSALKLADKVMSVAERYDPQVQAEKIRERYRSSNDGFVTQLPPGAVVVPLGGG